MIVPDGCVGSTKDFVFYPSDRSFTIKWNVEYDLPDVADFRSGLLLAGNLSASDIEEFHAIAARTSLDLSNAQASINLAKKAVADGAPHKAHVFTNSALIIIVGLLLISWCIFLRKTDPTAKNSSNTADHPSAYVRVANPNNININVGNGKADQDTDCNKPPSAPVLPRAYPAFNFSEHS